MTHVCHMFFLRCRFKTQDKQQSESKQLLITKKNNKNVLQS